MIRRYIIWRNNHAYDERLRRIVDKAKSCLMWHLPLSFSDFPLISWKDRNNLGVKH